MQNEISKELTDIILERDKNRCVLCGCRRSHKLIIHHIDNAPGVSGDDLEYIESKLVTICNQCASEEDERDLLEGYLEGLNT